MAGAGRKSGNIQLSHGDADFPWHALRLLPQMLLRGIDYDARFRQTNGAGEHEQKAEKEFSQRHPAILPDAGRPT